jgi:TolB-like protein
VDTRTLGQIGPLSSATEDQRLIRTLPRTGVRLVGQVQDARRAPAPSEASAPALTLPDRPSIAVLPFANMSGEAVQEYFADGVVEDIITALSRVSWLFVIARNSSFVYKGRTVDVKLGKELGLRYVLEAASARRRAACASPGT